jgi:hypothetical protein
MRCYSVRSAAMVALLASSTKMNAPVTRFIA